MENVKINNILHTISVTELLCRKQTIILYYYYLNKHCHLSHTAHIDQL